jgi:hypothetical protein
MRNLRTKSSLRNLRTTILTALFGCDSGLQRRHRVSQDSLKPRIRLLSLRMKTVLVTVACVTLAAITTTIASNPGTSNITVPSSSGQKVVINWTGSIPPLVNGTSDCSKLAGTPAVDQHVSTVTVPNNIYNSLNAKFTFQITWANSDNDEILTVIKPDGTAFPSSDGGTPSETVVGNNLAGGAYKIVACGFVSGPDPQPYSGTLTIETSSNASPPPPSPTPTPVPTPVIPYVPRYYNYVAGTSLGEGAGEPTIGYNLNTKRAMYIAGLQTLQVTFPESIMPVGSIPEAGPADWKDVSFITTRTRSLDPILFTDQGTGRTFVSQLNDVTQVYSATGNGLTLIGLNSLMAYSDDDGASWTPAQLNPPDGSYDHQTVGGGPYPAALSALANPINKGSAVYYCAQAGLTAYCSRSDDGGLNFGKAMPLYAAISVGGTAACGGIHGHVKVAPDGTVYIPNYSCGGKQGLIVSTDAGTTWTIRQVTGSLPPVAGILDPSVGISKDPPEPGGTSNTIYFSYVGKQPGTVPAAEVQDNHVYVAVSRDRGVTWDPPVDVGISVGVKNAVFPAAVAGDAKRAAVAFIGTNTTGNHEAADFKGTWYGYVAHTYDGGRTWTTVNATPGGPVQREACIWNEGGNNPCRNLLDFNDAAVDEKGRVLFAYADGCVDGCETGGPNSYTAKASIARQSGGKGLFAQYDMPEPVAPKSPYLTGFRDDMASYLIWNPPDNGGSAIAAYNIYRRGSSGSEKLVGQASGKATSYNDRTVDSLVSTYIYRITAVNGIGEGASSNSVSLVVEPRREATGACQAPGVTAIFDPAGDASDTLPSHDITSVSMAEPEDLPGKLVFTLKVANLQTIPPGGRWAVRFGVSKGGIQQSPPTDVTDGPSEDYFVSMVTSDGAAPTFTWGVTSVPQGASRVFTTKGSLDGASKVEANGAITLVISKSLINNPGPGDFINNMLGSVRATVPSALPGTGGTNETIPDSTGPGSYTLRSTTLCLPNTAPVAVINADTDHGAMPLTVNFTGSGSYDVDSIDSIASYTFNFGDGGDDVTQKSSTISHTFIEEGEYIVRLVVTDSRGKVSSNTAQFHVEAEGASPTPTPTPTPQPPSCIEDDGASVTYSNGWHLINSGNASGGHFRYHQGSSSSHFAALDFNVPSGSTGSITYSFAKSAKGGSADVYLDGVFKQTVNFAGNAGTTQAPEFKPEYNVQFGALSAGAHKLEIKNLSGVVYVDAFCLQNSVPSAQPNSGPGTTTNQSNTASAGQTSTSGFTMPAGAQEISVVVAASLNVPYKLVLVNPSGVAVQTVDAANGVAVLNSTVNQSGTYLIKVVNVSLGPLQFTVTATPLVSR